jgi:FixJ family two-component response regulator
MTPSTPTVYLVDDERSVLTAVSRLLRSAGFTTESFGSAAAFLERHESGTPGCVVLDLAMPGMDGLAVQEALAERTSDLPVIFLTGRADVPIAVKAMKRGASDFLTKPVDDETLLAAVRKALDRSRTAHRERLERDDLLRRHALLTPREAEVFARVVTGKLNKQIAQEIGTAEKTVKVHRARVMSKMEADSVADLVRMWERIAASIGPTSAVAGRERSGGEHVGPKSHAREGKSP